MTKIYMIRRMSTKNPEEYEYSTGGERPTFTTMRRGKKWSAPHHLRAHITNLIQHAHASFLRSYNTAEMVELELQVINEPIPVSEIIHQKVTEKNVEAHKRKQERERLEKEKRFQTYQELKEEFES